MTLYHPRQILKFLAVGRSLMLHVVARKGGDVVYTLCGEAHPKRRSRTLTEVDQCHYVCAACERKIR